MSDTKPCACLEFAKLMIWEGPLHWKSISFKCEEHGDVTLDSRPIPAAQIHHHSPSVNAPRSSFGQRLNLRGMTV